MTNLDNTPAAHDHAIEKADSPYMVWGTTAFYLDRCVICGRIFERERSCLRNMDIVAHNAAEQR